MRENRTGVVVLAAGASRRMGTPKQLLNWKGRSLIQHAACRGIDAGGDPVIVVLGAHASSIQKELCEMSVLIANNDGWASGMGETVACGISALLRAAPDATGVLLMPADQPRVESSSLKRLIEAGIGAPHQLAAAHYERTVGTPAYFGRGYFPELLQLAGAHGAREVLERHAAFVQAVTMPEAAFDLDTWEDYVALDGGPQTCPEKPALASVDA